MTQEQRQALDALEALVAAHDAVEAAPEKHGETFEDTVRDWQAKYREAITAGRQA